MDAKAPTKINEEAARWVVRMEAGALSEAEQRGLDAWLDAAPQHRGALVRARAAWVDLDRLGALAGPTPSDTKNSAAHKYRFVLSRRWALAASLATLAIVSSSFFAFTRDRNVYESGIGEVRRVTLVDGSSMVLNTATKAAVRFDEATREVRLDRGEALFQVHKDMGRPFIVRIGDATVRAVGTAFAVRIDGGTVDVTVTEGVVEVTHARELPRRVVANQRAVVQPAHPVAIEPIEPVIAQRQLAWRDGMVIFNGEPLGEAVVEVNRHSFRRIVVDDPALSAKPVVGIFRVGDVDGFAQAAATVLGAQVHADGDEILLIPGGSP